MHRYGLKLWSINKVYVHEAVELFRQRVFAYIEIFVVPGSFSGYSELWSGLEIPAIIHAPHFDKGVNLAKRECLETNLQLAAETIRFADRVKADRIIFHPGIEGDVKETVYQLRQINDQRILIENKPYYGHNGVLCVGSSPEEIEFVMEEANVGFCLDIGHAICAANTRKVPPLEYLGRFFSLRPTMYHLTDGAFDGIYDRHDHLGKGTYPLPKILNLMPRNSVITVETDKDFADRLDDFTDDILYLNSISEDTQAKE